LVKTYPEGNSRAEAQYWLGRSLFSRGEFHAAATMFLDSHNAYPDAKLAPETLLQLGLSMAGLNHREIACATYAEVLKQYPGANDAVKTQVAIERKSAGC
jgi:tol-pal system protein YbgF